MKNQNNKPSKIERAQVAPVAKGHSLMSSANQFRTKQVRDPKKYAGAICVTGHEYLSAIVETAAVVGENLLTLPLNPLSFDNTRLKLYAQMYEKYCFRKFVLHYTSADPSTATGQYIVAYDRDFADTTPPASDIGVREYFAMKGSVISNVYMSTAFRCPLEDPQDFYFTNDTGYEGRLVYQGQLYMAAVSGTTFHGSLWIEYELELYDPAIETPSSIISGTKAEPSFTSNAAILLDVDLFKYADTEVVSPDKVRFKSFTVSATDDYYVPVGYRGILVPPGVWYFDYRLSDKEDSSGEGFLSHDPTINGFKWTRALAENHDLTGLVPVIDNDHGVEIIENSGIGIADSHSSYVTRFIVSIPAAIGYVWLFLSGALTASPVTIYYNEAIITILLALSPQEIEAFRKKSGQPRKKNPIPIKGNQDISARKLLASSASLGKMGSSKKKT